MIQASSGYRSHRYWHLHTLRRLRACVRIGSMADTTAHKARKAIQREMVKLRGSQPKGHNGAT